VRSDKSMKQYLMNDDGILLIGALLEAA